MDIDFAALQTTNDVESIRQDVIGEIATVDLGMLVDNLDWQRVVQQRAARVTRWRTCRTRQWCLEAIAGIALPDHLDDGLTFDLADVTAQVIRDQDQYSGVRVRLAAGLATARERFHVDVNVGDPIWPAPTEIELPRLLGQPAISLRGYPMEMVLAEKTITALQLGIARTRWRDFGDIYQLTGQFHLIARTVRAAFEAVAAYRTAELTTFAVELDGYAEVAQSKWFAWRSRHDLTDRLPTSFQVVLDAVTVFADPVLIPTLTVTDWDPATRSWSSVATVS